MILPLPTHITRSKEGNKPRGAQGAGDPDVAGQGLEPGPLESPGRVPDEVADAVEGVEGEGPGDEELEPALCEGGPGAHGGGDAGRLEVPARQRGGQVGGAEAVQGRRQERARDALPDGAAEEGLLVVVDPEVRAYGPAEALLGQERVVLGLCELGCERTFARGVFWFGLLVSPLLIAPGIRRGWDIPGL